VLKFDNQFLPLKRGGNPICLWNPEIDYENGTIDDVNAEAKVSTFFQLRICGIFNK
jgi:hypothetical protein